MKTLFRPGQILAEISLVGVSFALILSISRIFDSWSFLSTLLPAAIIAHFVSIMMRRLPVLVSMLASFTGVLVFLTLKLYGDFLFKSEIFTQINQDFQDSWNTLQGAEMPVAVTPGMEIFLAGLLWVFASTADASSFRSWSSVQPVILSIVGFFLVSLLGEQGGWFSLTVVFVLAISIFVLSHRTVKRAGQKYHSGQKSVSREWRYQLLLGAPVLVLAVLAGAVLGPVVPGARSEPIWEPDEITRSEPIIVVSPIIDIRRQLTDFSGREVFTVESDIRSYWRLTSLDSFDGNIWKSSASYKSVGGKLGIPFNTDNVNVKKSSQSYRITNLGSIWLPAAYSPQRIESDLDLRYNVETSTIILDRSKNLGIQRVYEVESLSPVLTKSDLQKPDSAIPAEISEKYLFLPATFSDDIADMASEITASGRNEYEKALLLQNWFQDNFEYDVEVNSGHSSNRMEDFIEERRGYCEQFAGTYAAMARSAGLPARVAIGFTPGERDAENPNLYHVRDEFAHAWPEVYISGIGWTAFEPTPGRGAPGAEDYTGLPEAQETPDVSNDLLFPPPFTDDPEDLDGATAPREEGEAPAATEEGEATVLVAGDSKSSGLGVWLVAIPVLLLALYVSLVLANRNIKQARLKKDPLRHSWKYILSDISLLGGNPLPSETSLDLSRRLSGAPYLDSEAFHNLAVLETKVGYGKTPLKAAERESFHLYSARVATRLKKSVPLVKKIYGWITFA